MEINKIICGDTLKILKTLPDDYVDTIITSPPYWGLRDYGVEGQIGLEKTLDEYLDKLLAIISELKRVLKPTGVMFWNHGDCYGGSGMGTWKNPPENIKSKEVYRIPYESNVEARKKIEMAKCLMLQNYRLILKMIDEQGWILRNSICWFKPNHMPSSVKDRFANSYEPVFMLVKNNDPIYYYNTKTGLMVDKKPKELKEGIDWDWKKQEEYISESGSNIGEYNKEPYKNNNPHLLRLNKKKTEERKKVSYWKSVSYWFDLDAVRVKVNYPEDVARRIKQDKEAGVKPFQKGDPISRHTKIPRSQAESFGSPRARQYRKVDITAEFFKKKGSDGNTNLPWKPQKYITPIPKGKNPGDVWKIATQPFPEAHFATFPEKLIEPMILSSCPKEICKKCGMARVRIIKTDYIPRNKNPEKGHNQPKQIAYVKQCYQSGGSGKGRPSGMKFGEANAQHKTLGWTNCNCGAGFNAGIILDPFVGSGTVAIVAKRLGRNYIGIELNKEYIKIAEQRIKAQPEPLL